MVTGNGEFPNAIFWGLPIWKQGLCFLPSIQTHRAGASSKKLAEKSSCRCAPSPQWRYLFAAMAVAAVAAWWQCGSSGGGSVTALLVVVAAQ